MATTTTSTSKTAANSIARSVKDLRTKVYSYVRSCPDGATCDEIEQHLTMLHQTASARCRELVLMGQLERRKDFNTGMEMQRPTRSGRKASVLFAVDYTMEPRKYTESDFAWALSKILNNLNSRRDLCDFGLSNEESSRIFQMRKQATERAKEVG